MGRKPCSDRDGVKRGQWSSEEDRKLINFIQENGIQCWSVIPQLAGLSRCGKSCRLRWVNYLRPDLKKGKFSETEDDLILQLHERLGNRWSEIASHLPGRTDSEIKNHWHTRRMINKRQPAAAPRSNVNPSRHHYTEQHESNCIHEEMEPEPDAYNLIKRSETEHQSQLYQEMGRKPCSCCHKISVKRGQWTREEDRRLKNFIQNHGIQRWGLVPKLAGLLRCGRSCRFRWVNYLRPNLRKEKFSESEEDMIIELQASLGNRWSEIASHLPGRTDSEVKNHWHTIRMTNKRLASRLSNLNPSRDECMEAKSDELECSEVEHYEKMERKYCYCCDKNSVKRGQWSREEDWKLKNFIQMNGIVPHWKEIPKLAGLSRCGRSCRLRWLNYLRPNLMKGKFSEREEDKIIELQGRLGNRWSEIASHFPGRSDNEIKNHWHTKLMIQKRQQGVGSSVSENITEDQLEMEHQPIQQLEMVVVKSELREEEASEAKNGGIDMINYYNVMCRSLDMGLWLTTQESDHSIR